MDNRRGLKNNLQVRIKKNLKKNQDLTENQIRELHTVLSQVNEWLKFAESKNGALLAVEGGALIAIFSIISNLQINVFSIFGLVYIFLLLICLFLSITVILISFIPVLDSIKFDELQDCDEDLNICYYGHIAKLSPEQYLNKFYKNQNLQIEKITQYELNLAHQIVNNSNIAYKKYTWFKLAIWLTLSAFLTPVATLLIYFIIRWRK